MKLSKKVISYLIKLRLTFYKYNIHKYIIFVLIAITLQAININCVIIFIYKYNVFKVYKLSSIRLIIQFTTTAEKESYLHKNKNLTSTQETYFLPVFYTGKVIYILILTLIYLVWYIYTSTKIMFIG